MLTRYWFKTDRGLGFGVTAMSVADAEALLRDARFVRGRDFEVLEIIENVDVRTLDQNHVTPNMGPPNFRGVWFPLLNI
jgi:hypothetical protein